MEERLNEILSRRGQRRRLWFRGASLAVAAALHIVPVLALVVAPKLFAERREPTEFVAVQIVPAISLPRRQAPPPPPEPQAKTAEPEPEKPPPPKEAPVLPDPNAKKTTQRSQQRQSSSAPAAAEPQANPGPPSSGSAQGTTPAAVVGFDNPDFTYGYYVDRMLALIRAHWVRPPLGGDVKMVVHFRIRSDGRVTEVQIVQSSGYSSFDLAGRRAVEAASPLPPLPRSYRHPSLGVNLIIR